MTSILRTISRYQQIQLEKKGATVTDGLITASDDVLWRTLSPYQRKELEKLGQVALSGDDSGGSYAAKGVHFDGTLSISIGSLIATDNQDISFVGWFKLAPYSDTADFIAWVVNSAGTYRTFLDLGGGQFGPATGDLQLAWSNADGSKFNSWYTTPNFLPVGQWVCFIGSASSAAPTTGDFYQGDTDITATFVDHGDEPFTIQTNGQSIIFGNDTFGNAFVGDAADWRFLPGVSLLNEDGEIPLATRRLFIDEHGKPVDPAVATAALGTAGAVLFQRTTDDPLEFGENKGPGGSSTWTGTPTNSTSSPSD